MSAYKESPQTHHSVYVIAGKDATLVNAECDRLLNELIPHNERATGLLRTEANRVSVTDVFDELRTLPFLTNKRVVVLSCAEKFISDNRRSLEEYFDNPSPTGVLVMTVSNFDSRTRLAKKLGGTGKLIAASSPAVRELPERLRRYAHQAYGKSLAAEATELLIELAGVQLLQLYSEIDKLAVYASDKKQISLEDVRSLTGHNRLYNLFDVIDLVISKNAAKALNQLRRVFIQDKSSEYTFVGAMAYHLRRMFTAKVMLGNGMDQWQVGKKLRIWYSRDSFFDSLGRASLHQIGSLIQELAWLDYNIKTGRKNVQAAAEELILRLAADYS